MKLHVGVDVGTGNIKTLAAGPANEHDLGRAAELIQDDDEVVYGDAGYTGIEKRPEIRADEPCSIPREPGLGCLKPVQLFVRTPIGSNGFHK